MAISQVDTCMTFLLLIPAWVVGLVWSLIRWNWLKLMEAVTHAQDCINNQSFDGTLSIHVSQLTVHPEIKTSGQKMNKTTSIQLENNDWKIISAKQVAGRHMINQYSCFICPGQLYMWPCHSLTHTLTESDIILKANKKSVEFLNVFYCRVDSWQSLF